MNENHPTQTLHDQATRGAAISSDQRGQLDEWYSREDTAEHASLARTTSLSGVAGLRRQVEAAVAQLSALTQRIDSQTAANETLRREIASLQMQLTQKTTAQPA